MNLEDYTKYYIQNSDHYLVPKDVFIELFNEMINWKEESQELNQKYLNAVADYETTMAEKNELKKQLEEKENIACNWKDSCLENAGKIEKLENQQKEFIKYLEDMLNDENDIFSVVRVKDVLSKYKEIIGGKNDR